MKAILIQIPYGRALVLPIDALRTMEDARIVALENGYDKSCLTETSGMVEITIFNYGDIKVLPPPIVAVDMREQVVADVFTGIESPPSQPVPVYPGIIPIRDEDIPF